MGPQFLFPKCGLGSWCPNFSKFSVGEFIELESQLQISTSHLSNTHLLRSKFNSKGMNEKWGSKVGVQNYMWYHKKEFFSSLKSRCLDLHLESCSHESKYLLAFLCKKASRRYNYPYVP